MDNNTGRFISRDPIKDGYNWYSYCAGNPISYVDPNGLEILSVETGSTDILEIKDGVIVRKDDNSKTGISFDVYYWPGEVGGGNIPAIDSGSSSSSFSFFNLSYDYGGSSFSLPALQTSEYSAYQLLQNLNTPYFGPRTRFTSSGGGGSFGTSYVYRPDPEVAKQKKREAWEKLVASSRPMADAWLGSQAYRGERDSQKSMVTGNEEETENSYLKLAKDATTDALIDSSPLIRYIYEWGMFVTNEQYREDTITFWARGDTMKNVPVTRLALMTNVILGFSGIDAPIDARDLGGSIYHGDYVGAIFNGIGLVPFFGMLKNFKYASDVRYAKYYDEMSNIKHTDEYIKKQRDARSAMRSQTDLYIKDKKKAIKDFAVAQDGRVWMSHYTSLDNAKSIMNGTEQIIYKGRFEEGIYVMIEPATMNTAFMAGASNKGAKIMFKADITYGMKPDINKTFKRNGKGYDPRAWLFPADELDLKGRGAILIDFSKEPNIFERLGYYFNNK